jgi:hypothetical protein
VEKSPAITYRWRRPENVAQAVPGLLLAACRAQGFSDASLHLNWAALVGPDFARLCTPIKLRFPAQMRRDGVLEVHVKGPAALELQHLEKQLIDRLNSLFGYQAIARLRYKTT